MKSQAPGVEIAWLIPAVRIQADALHLPAQLGHRFDLGDAVGTAAEEHHRAELGPGPPVSLWVV